MPLNIIIQITLVVVDTELNLKKPTCINERLLTKFIIKLAIRRDTFEYFQDSQFFDSYD